MKKDAFKCIFLTLLILLLVPWFINNLGWFCVIGAPLISLDIFFMMKLARQKKILQSSDVKKSFSYRLISWISYIIYICFLILVYGFIIFSAISNSKNGLGLLLFLLFIMVLILPYLSLPFCTNEKIKKIRTFSNLLICIFVFCWVCFEPCHSDICFNGIFGGTIALIAISIPLFVHNLLINLGKYLLENSDK